jgi:hypothetical protein
MGSEERDGRALALSLRVVIARRPNCVIRVTIREVQEGPLIFSWCFVKCTKNIAKGSVGAIDKDERVVLNRRDFIYLNDNSTTHTVILIFFLNLNWIILSKLTVTTVRDTCRDKATYVFLHKTETLHFHLVQVAGSAHDTVWPHDRCTLAVLVGVEHCHGAARTTVLYTVL